MIRKFTLTLAIASLLLGAAISASAQKRGVGYLGPPVREGQNARHTQRRIRQGVRSGELTKREAQRLHWQQQRLHQDAQRARADYRVTERERARLTRERERASRHIYRAKHNNRDNKHNNRNHDKHDDRDNN